MEAGDSYSYGGGISDTGLEDKVVRQGFARKVFGALLKQCS
jgi:hypothetical protein